MPPTDGIEPERTDGRGTMIQRADIIGCGVNELEAAKLLTQVEALSGTPEARWREAARCILRPDHPFALHQLLYRAIYGSAGGPVFFPPNRQTLNTRI